MTRRNLAYSLIGIAWAAVGLCPAQVTAEGGQPMFDMDDRTMQEKYNIPPTEQGWMSALRHENPDVRSLAALRLADGGYKEAVPPLLAAGATDAVPRVRIAMASAAARLGSEDGFAALQSMCQDRAFLPGVRMSAAQTMLLIGRESCLGAVMATIRSREDDEATFGALHLLSRFQNVTPAQSSDINASIAACLKSESIMIRIGASYALRQVGDAWAAGLLRGAVEAERNDGVRRILAADLAFIERK